MIGLEAEARTHSVLYHHTVSGHTTEESEAVREIWREEGDPRGGGDDPCKKCGWELFYPDIEGENANYKYCSNPHCHFHTNAYIP